MKFFTNKSIVSKIVIILVFIIIFEFIVAKPSLGDDGEDLLEWPGKLLTPVLSLFVSLGDGVVHMIHTSIMGINNTLIPVDLESDWWNILEKIFTIGAIIGTVVLCVVCPVLLAGASTIGGMVAVLGTNVVPHLAGIFMSSLFVGGVVNFAMEGLGDITGFGLVRSYSGEQLPDTLQLPTYTISPEEIFQGKVLLFNVNFFSKGKKIEEKKDVDGNIQYYYYEEDGKEIPTSPQDSAMILRETIGKWYMTLRNIGIVIMMIVLLYVGIRILLSSVASDKAKYVQLLKDWAVGMVLLFVMHYIMTFSNVIVEDITEVVSTSVDKTMYFVEMEGDSNGKLIKFMKDPEHAGEIGEALVATNESGNEVVVWPTNLMGRLRISAQMSKGNVEFIGYALAFVALVVLLLMFIFTYIRRVLYMAFLTLIAPLVAVTYPIDKITDGKAQGFDKWFKEYIFNLLIQPMHLLLYYILISSAIDLINENFIYALCAIGFMLPAEKILRNFFGFEKASTPSRLGDAATGALAAQGFEMLRRMGQKSSKKNEEKNDNSKIREASTNGAEGKDDSKVTFSKDPVNEVDTMSNLFGNQNSNDNEEEIEGELPEGDSAREEEIEGELPEGDSAREEEIEGELPEEDSVREEEIEGELPEEDSVREEEIEGEPPEEDSVREEEIEGEPPEEDSVRESESTENIDNNNLGRSNVKRYSAAIGKGAKAAFKRMPTGAVKLAGKGIRLAAPIVGILGGAAMAIPTGNIGNVTKFAALGAGVGNTIGKKVSKTANRNANRMNRELNLESAKHAYKSEINKDKDRVIEKEKNQVYGKNKKIYERHNYDLDDMHQVSDRCVENKITDSYQTIAISQMALKQNPNPKTEEEKINSINEAIAIKKYSDRIGDAHGTDREKKYRKQFQEEFMDHGMDKKQAKVAVRNLMNKIDNYKKIEKEVAELKKDDDNFY